MSSPPCCEFIEAFNYIIQHKPHVLHSQIFGFELKLEMGLWRSLTPPPLHCLNVKFNAYTMAIVDQWGQKGLSPLRPIATTNQEVYDQPKKTIKLKP